jgi:hypothetical protein
VPASRHGALALRLKRAVPEAGAPVYGKAAQISPASLIFLEIFWRDLFTPPKEAEFFGE